MTDEQATYQRGIRRSRRMAIGFVIAAIVIGVIGARYQDRGMKAEQAPPSTRIEYSVTGTSPSVTVTYLNDLAFTDTKSGTPPWKYGFRAIQGRQLSLVVTNTGSGTIGCAIRGNGKDLAAITDSTEATITCVAVVP